MEHGLIPAERDATRAASRAHASCPTTAAGRRILRAARQAGDPSLLPTVAAVYKRAMRIACGRDCDLRSGDRWTDLEKLNHRPGCLSDVTKASDAVINDPRKNTHDELVGWRRVCDIDL